MQIHNSKRLSNIFRLPIWTTYASDLFKCKFVKIENIMTPLENSSNR